MINVWFTRKYTNNIRYQERIYSLYNGARIESACYIISASFPVMTWYAEKDNMAPLSLLIVVWSSLIIGTNSHTCAVKRTLNIDHLINCRHRNLDHIPSDIIDPSTVTSLDLSSNIITFLAADAFREFPRLVNLNMSTAGIHNVHEAAFRGLDHLKVLDLTNNEFLHNQKDVMPNSLFEGCPHLIELYISGNYVRGSIFSYLKDLEEVTMTPNIWYMPYELGNLTKLRVLNFAFCQDIHALNHALLQPFSSAPVEEVAFHSCNLQHIDDGAFDNFTSLRLLNFACNTEASVANILDVLSHSSQVEIESLVLDMVGYKAHVSTPVTLGRLLNGECYRVWEYLRHLSIRGANLQWIERLSCLKKLISMAGGFNSPAQLAIHWLPSEDLFTVLEQIRYFDASHLFVLDDQPLIALTGCNINASWIPPNHSYFPKINPEWKDINCTHNGTESDMTYREMCKKGVDFFTYTLPPCLTYLKLDNMVYHGVILQNRCNLFPESNLRYFNLSYKSGHGSLYYEETNAMGLNMLEIVDMCSTGMVDYNEDMIRNFPNVRELFLCKNSIGTGNMAQFTHVPHLRVLDLSDNKISSISSNMFSLLDSLELLNLNFNFIRTTDWLSPNLKKLEFLYLSGNEISHVDVVHFRPFERRTKNRSLHLDLGNNPLLCGCDQLDAMLWIQSTNIVFIDRYAMSCDQNSSIFDEDIDALRAICGNVTLKIILGSMTVATAVFLIVGGIIVYRYRWSIKWKYYKARYIKNKANIELRQIGKQYSAGTFSTFIIYPHDDSQISHWVIQNLRNKIETEWQRKECFIRGRNDIPGHYEIDNIVEGLTHSQTALWVICPTFFDDRWCEMAANFAFHHLGVNNNAFIIMETRLDKYRVPKQFANLFNPKLGSTRFRYTDDDDGRRLFWSTLEAFIPT